MDDEVKTNRAHTLEEYKKLREKCFNFKLKEGESITLVVPGFDLRDGDDRQYGQSSATLAFAKRKGRKAVSVEFHTGWTVSGDRILDGRRDIGFICSGLYTHHRFKKDAGVYAHVSDNCPYTGGKCYGELGSSLYGDVLLSRLVNEGSAGVWDEIEKELQ